MATIRAYHRPTTLEAALELLTRADVRTVALGGGTEINGLPAEAPEEVVDLQALGLSAITAAGNGVAMGATATLRELIDAEPTPPLLRDLARREAPNTIRNAATVGGTVATADRESGLYAGLLVHEATVTIAGVSGSEEVPLRDLGEDGGGLVGRVITSVRIRRDGQGDFAATGRTPADDPIVLVAGRRVDDGEVLLAATGVAARPVLISPDAVDGLAPPSDFRGSAPYRRHLASVLTDRVVARLSEARR